MSDDDIIQRYGTPEFIDDDDMDLDSQLSLNSEEELDHNRTDLQSHDNGISAVAVGN